MIGQYLIVGLIVLVAAVYTIYKFSRVLKGKDSNCTTCKGCDLRDMKSDSEKSACAGPDESESEKNDQ